MLNTRINSSMADSRMLDFYDKLLGLGLGSGLYAGKQKELNQVLHSKVVPYVREHHPEYVPVSGR